MIAVANLLVVALAATAPQQPAPSARGNPFPFAAGERAVYEIKYKGLTPGDGAMEVIGADTVRGRHALRLRFAMRASFLGFSYRDSLQSWVDTATFVSLRYHQDAKQTGKSERDRRYEIFPERSTYADRGRPERPSVPDPLDDLSFLFFARTLPLEAGRAPYKFSRYFKPESNPVTLIVVRRDTITVPYGTFVTTVVQPIIKTTRMFSDDGHALVWIADDPGRTIVRVQIKLAVVGDVTFQLKSLRASASAPTLTKKP